MMKLHLPSHTGASITRKRALSDNERAKWLRRIDRAIEEARYIPDELKYLNNYKHRVLCLAGERYDVRAGWVNTEYALLHDERNGEKRYVISFGTDETVLRERITLRKARIELKKAAYRYYNSVIDAMAKHNTGGKQCKTTT